MALIERQVAIAAAATAAALSPEAREALRKGAVYGVAGVLKAGDVVISAAHGAIEGVQSATGDSSAPDPKPASSSKRAPSSKRARGSKNSAARERPRRSQPSRSES
jgi:nucleoside phosphorylase